MTMLYKIGNQIQWEGLSLDYIVVPSNELEQYIINGWYRHPDDIPVQLNNNINQKKKKDELE